MKKFFSLVFLSTILLLSSCIYFQTIDQPTIALPNQIITVTLTVTTEGGEDEPYFGVCLPIGWIIPGDSVQCSGGYNETIYYDSLVSAEQESVSPAPTEYYWWVGKGAIDTNAVGEVYADLFIQLDNQTGIFSLDYMLGNSNPELGVNQQRSDNHLIEVADETTPYGLQAEVIEESIILSWSKPFNPSGLLGYHIYRDTQRINPVLIMDTTFIDANPLEGIHYYKVSSFYNDGSEYIIPYEVRAMYGNCLYVSPSGSNNNDGSSFGEALLTIDFALSMLQSDSLNHKTIYLYGGVYSPGSTGEVFPLRWKNYISLVGISKEQTILDGENLNRIVEVKYVSEAKFKNLTLRNGHFNQQYEKGGGVYCYYSSPDFENIKIENNFFSGISLDYSDPKFENVEITDNSGSGILISYSNPSLRNVIIANNSNIYSGGGVSIYRSNPLLENLTIENNSADWDGGGIDCFESSAFLKNVTIRSNSAGKYGGGICCSASSMVLENISISYNSASDGGGGICSHLSNPLLLNVTITCNSSIERGDGILVWLSNPLLRNCIIWADSLTEIYMRNTSTITISYSDVQGGEAGIVTNNNTVNWLEGNLDEDPFFVGNGDYPYLLSSSSPCIDAGDSNPIYNDPEDPNNLGFALWPAMGTIRNDMGAYGGPKAASWNIIVTGVEEDENEEIQTPAEFELAQNYPNPFNPSTTIQYSIKERSNVELVLYDILGSQVAVLVNEEQIAGRYRINFNAGRLASGIYLFRIKAGDFVQTKKMLLLK